MSRLWADVMDSAGDVLGNAEGPVMLESATITRLLDGSGGIKLAYPASVRGRELLTAGRYIKVWYEEDSGNILLGEGVIKKAVIGAVDAQDLLEELKYDNTLFNYQIDSLTVQAAISGLIAPLGWTIEASGSALTALVSLSFKAESKLKAVLSVAESTGVHVRLSPRGGRVIEVGDFGAANDITLFDASSGAGGDDTCGVIESLTIEEQGDQIANRILPEGGAFDSGANVTLSSSDREDISTIAGHDGALNYYIENTASIAEYGVRWLYKSYPGIKPLAAGAPAETAAANQLYVAAYADLVNQAWIRRNYKGKVRGLTTPLQAGDLVRVLYNEPIYTDEGDLWPGGALDEYLYINRAETYAGEGGWWQNVDLSNVNGQRKDEATDVAISVERSKRAT